MAKDSLDPVQCQDADREKDHQGLRGPACGQVRRVYPAVGHRRGYFRIQPGLQHRGTGSREVSDRTLPGKPGSGQQLLDRDVHTGPERRGKSREALRRTPL